jgi:hybrid cluster-associated redox disulfide protein
MSHQTPNIPSNVTVHMLLEKYPQAVRVFFKLGMQCPGCPAEGFHTLEEATRAHNRDPEVFFQELEQELFSENESGSHDPM